MYKIDLPVDMREDTARERRRNAEQQRKSHVFDPRIRQIGVDVQALEQQVNERKMLQAEESHQHQAFAADMVRTDKLAAMLQERQSADVRQLNMALSEYRKAEQTVDTRREFDLNDPETKKKATPARVSDDDPRCCVSGLQKLQGEDLSHKARVKLQQEQMHEWAMQQTKEKRRRQQEQDHSDHLHDLKAIELDQRALQLAEAEIQCRQAIKHAAKDFNVALARETDAKRRLEKTQEEDNNFTELSNQIHGDLLTENPQVAGSAFGPQRVITANWKGMSPQQVVDIRQEQDMQREEKKRIEEAERQDAVEWERQTVTTARVGLMMEDREDKTRKQLARELMLENQRLAAEQKKRQEYLDREVYTNRPTDAYFSQFNTTTR